MADKRYDVAIIGGGHNGLVAATLLARARHSVVVLEKNAVVGGCAVTEAFAPGFRNSVAAYTVSLLAPRLIRDLDLARHGLEIRERPVANFWPIDATRHLLLPYGIEARQRAIASHSVRDAERLPAYEAAIGRAAAIVRRFLGETPPNAGGGWGELLKGASLGRRMLSLTSDDQRLISDLVTRSAADFLAAWFESDVVRAAFAFDGIVGAYAAPSTPGTAYLLLHLGLGEVNGRTGVWGHAVGGMGAISAALGKAAAEAGVEIRCAAKASEVIVEQGRAAGVRLADGRVVRARTVAAGIPPKLLIRDLVPEGAVDPEVRARFLAIRSGSGVFRMNVALAELPDFRCLPGTTAAPHHASGIIIGASLDYLERAYLDARLHGWSNRPIVEMLIPSTLDTTLAPPGRHVASLFVQHVAPRLPEPRTWADPAQKETFAERVIDTVTQHAPNFRASILARQILSPHDLEERFGLVDGDIYHGQLGLDQLFSTRPVLGFAGYRMPVPGLYLCGAGAHPGGGVSGLPGANAAREIARDLASGWRSRRGGSMGAQGSRAATGAAS